MHRDDAPALLPHAPAGRSTAHAIAVPGSDVPILFGPGAVREVPALVRRLDASRVLLVTDAGVRDAGHVEPVVRDLYRAGVVVRIFDGTVENPTTHTVTRALRVAMDLKPDAIIGFGGGSSMDTAKGVNFLFTNGGRMEDYKGTGKATRPMLPMIAVPTTAGTGSEAQSYALISDADTHAKMACGDRKALPRFAVLDPALVRTVPAKVAAATGIDAVSHAVETAASTRRNEVSRSLSKRAWAHFDAAFEKAMRAFRDEAPSRQAALADGRLLDHLLLGAHLAGAAIENSMLGAAHACANPLTARFDVTHGVAVGLMLPHVVRFNASAGDNPYADLACDAEALAARLEAFLDAAGLPRRLADVGVREDALPDLANLAAAQWTATFNPRPVGPDELLTIYRMAA